MISRFFANGEMIFANDKILIVRIIVKQTLKLYGYPHPPEEKIRGLMKIFRSPCVNWITFTSRKKKFRGLMKIFPPTSSVSRRCA